MNTKHTPGPWEVSPMNNVYFVTTQICALPGMDEEERANARLIAAAPELLDICESILAEVEYEGLELESGRIAKLRAAIAKATGETAKAPIKLSGYIRRAKEQNND